MACMCLRNPKTQVHSEGSAELKMASKPHNALLVLCASTLHCHYIHYTGIQRLPGNTETFFSFIYGFVTHLFMVLLGWHVCLIVLSTLHDTISKLVCS